MPNNLIVSGNLTINGTATYVNTQSISAKDPLFEVANDNNTTDAVDIGYYGRYYDTPQTRVEFTGLFRDASDAGKFKFFTGLVDEPTNVVNTTGTGYTVGTLVANFEGNLAGTANAANQLSTARTIAASGDATWSVSFDGSTNVSSALTLANTGVTATTYGTSTSVPTIAVDSKGRITSASNTNITFPVTTVNGFAGTVVLTTSDVAEGTNQYFTTARAQAAITGGASSVVTANLTASRALVSDGSGKIAASATTTTTEIGYLAGVTSAIQTQLDAKLNLTGGTLTGGLIGTTGSFSSSGSGDTFTIGHTSGSGIALNITKSGNGEGLYINKTSGSGNAATIVGNLGGTTGTFSGILTTPQVKAATSAGLSINANSGTQVADFGAGGSANITFFGGLSGTSATFSGAVTIGNDNAYALTIGRYSAAIPITYIKASTSSTGGFRLTNHNGADVIIVNGSNAITLDGATTTTGAATFSSSVTAGTQFIGSNTNTDPTAGITTATVYALNGPSSNNTFGIGIGAIRNSVYDMWFQTGAINGGGYRWYIGTSEKMTMSSTGNVGIGMTGYGDMRLVVRGATSNSSNFGLRIEDSSANALFQVRNDGKIETGLQSLSPYNRTTGSLGNLFVDFDGSLYRGTASSERFKENITDWNVSGLDTILALKPKTFTYKEDYYSQPDRQFLGLIAEEVAEVSPLLADFKNEDGTGDVENVRYATIVVPLIKAIQELEARIKDLEGK